MGASFSIGELTDGLARCDKDVLKHVLGQPASTIKAIFQAFESERQRRAAEGAGDEGEEGAGEEAGDGTADAGEEAAPEFDVAKSYNLTCGTCHGEAGDGNGPAGAALNPKPRDFTDAAWWDDEKTTDEHVAKVIKEGGPAVGLSPLMAPWGGQYDDEQIAAMVEHLKTFKK